jgi:hypothetical protein
MRLFVLEHNQSAYEWAAAVAISEIVVGVVMEVMTARNASFQALHVRGMLENFSMNLYFSSAIILDFLWDANASLAAAAWAMGTSLIVEERW